MKKYISIVIGILFILLPSCRSDEWVLPTINPSEVTLYFSTSTPDAGQMTRAVEEEVVSSVNVLVFEGENGADYEFSYAVTGYSLTTTANGYDFFARIAYSENSVKLYLVANYPVNNISVGASEESVRDALIGSFTSAGFEGALPMFGEVEFASGLTEDQRVEDAVLVRSVARADVINTTSNFTLTSVQIFRASNQFQIIPDQLVNDVVTTPSIPAGTTQSINTTQLAVTTTNSVEQLYLPEAPLVGPDGNQRLGVTCIVIGGLFGTDTEPTYYRLDFVPDDNPSLFGQILRNHQYVFNIGAVLAPGWRTPGEAAEYYSSQIEVTVKEWNESTVYMVFDDVNYFGVSTRTLRIPYTENMQRVISVDTSLDTYVLYWTDENGVIDTSVAPITLGESFTSPDGRFTVTISADGTQIIGTTNAVNNTGVQITDYLLAEAGRLRIRLTIIQDYFRIINSAVSVFGSTTGIGALGDYTLGAANTVPGDRARGMASIMLSTNNYGPSGIVPMQGINIAGRAGTTIYTPGLLELFDVVYLTFAQNPGPVQIDNILNWHATTNRRFLIIQFDNTRTTGSLTEADNTNYQILNRLGIVSYITRKYANVPYTLYEGAPDAITNGIFGPVDPGTQFRNYDDTYSVLDLDYALANGIEPILIAQGGVLFGIDFTNRIVYCGDIDIYSNIAGGTGEYPSATAANPDISGTNINAKRLIANFWATLIDIILAE